MRLKLHKIYILHFFLYMNDFMTIERSNCITHTHTHIHFIFYSSRCSDSSLSFGRLSQEVVMSMCM